VPAHSEDTMSGMDIPKDKGFPLDAVQCHECGGWGCEVCDKKGWLPKGHPKGRTCHRDGCTNAIPPAQVAVYCSNDCALADSGWPPLSKEDTGKLLQGLE
jgi:hypothetical protein